MVASKWYRHSSFMCPLTSTRVIKTARLSSTLEVAHGCIIHTTTHSTRPMVASHGHESSCRSISHVIIRQRDIRHAILGRIHGRRRI